MNGSIAGAVMFLTGSVCAQFTWGSLPAPGINTMAYDSVRDRIVMPNGATTLEYDGAAWTTLAGAGGSNVGACMVYDPVRQRTVALEAGTLATLEWDGSSWTSGAALPFFNLYPSDARLVFHRGRGKVIALTPMQLHFPVVQLEMYEWDGMSWTHIPSLSPFVISLSATGAYTSYGPCAYDSRRDKVIVFGSNWVVNGVPHLHASTWEWDPINDWVTYADSGPIDLNRLWFDEQRGAAVRLNMASPSSTLLRWDSGQGWIPIANLSSLPLTVYGPSSAYDSARNRFYYPESTTALAYLSDVHPASYTAHGSGCLGAQSPALGLTFPWTRAWLGSTLDLTAGGLPLSSGLLAMGFSDQSYGATPLPLDLSSYGMPGCMLRVAPDATALLVGANNTVSWQIPIPNQQSLLGIPFWQQVLAPAPGVNPAGMVTSASMRGTVGQAY